MKPKYLSFFLLILSACASRKPMATNDNINFTDDRDGHVYKTVKIGKQVWMAENLAYAVKDNESLIRCASYNNDPENGKLYGLLYSYNALEHAAPKGWHIPTNEEWQLMERNCADPVSTLCIIYGGEGRANTFTYLGAKATFYTTSHDRMPVITRYVNKGSNTIGTNRQGIAWMLSVRCVKDSL